MPRQFRRLRGVLAAQILKAVGLMLTVAVPRELPPACPPPDHTGFAGSLSCHASPVLYRLDPEGIGVDVSMKLMTGQTVACLGCCDFA